MDRPNTSKLKSKQLLMYKELILENGNVTQAYMNIYNCKPETANKNASAYMVKYGIDLLYKQYCEYLVWSAAKTKLVTMEEVLKNARDVADSCRDEKGEVTDKTTLLKANEQLGRTITAFSDKQVIKDETTDEQKETLKLLKNKSKIINFKGSK